MQYRTLGNSNLSLSELCFGPMRWDDVKEGGEKAFNRAVDLGVNVIHSSYEYNTIDQLGGACIGKHSKRNQLHHIIKVSTLIMVKLGLISSFFESESRMH
ncbi:hypothetical protein JCM21714_3660 [Gracilibacillus boraciitolerans JCM 21714]|uniref:Oxidoreductase n=1 Tax=Gracilibacillus boraciitolerans JCM 21714 TaxID=1298598 RepID=W4VP27_9BACI|nr:aldo/keto reductase [Gracilibacillus boraciitolerans]GAE94499.1 hypothetical protein JCM21714_3660 [Gracilibacillus boraciitolerans JCM 21714]